jgi:hypothetical protein
MGNPVVAVELGFLPVLEGAVGVDHRSALELLLAIGDAQGPAFEGRLPQRHEGVALADPWGVDQRPLRLAAGLVEVDALDHADLLAVAGGDLRALDLFELLGAERHGVASSG